MQLIKIGQGRVGGEEIKTVNARDLHEFLEVGKDFSTWVKDRIDQFGFTENQDFIVFPEIGEKGGRPQIVYHLTIDMAKELSMVERNDKGKQARQYFIQCEKQVKNIVPAQLPDFTNPILAARAWADEVEKTQVLQIVNAEMVPKVEALDRISNAEGNMCITNAAKDLQIKPKDLFALLSARKWIYRRVGGKNWVAYQDKLQSGNLIHKIKTVELSDGSEKITEQVLVSPKGLVGLASILSAGGNLQGDF